MRRGIAGSLARLGGERGALRDLRRVLPRGGAQPLHVGFGRAAGIRAGEPDTAPEVRASIRIESRDRGRNPIDVGTLDEPEAPAQALIEYPASVPGQPIRRAVVAHGFARMEVALMKTVSVHREPSKEGIEA